ncbi:tetratricopeptide repeat protein [Paraburkholderia lycopersici]|uniref:Uncharacterized protein n=1 Tax=Paraburkholderia lycopersici TaxID=416944 RepID=A0A1G7BFJ9_9BURK|nr:hypothetical protein [Paraburkholderia lycopersici]SDE25858.1 hypothetical protein SAMN05421548_13923 [Paraburkholderia lycopersici]
MSDFITRQVSVLGRMLVVAVLGVFGACASKEQGYAMGAHARTEIQVREAIRDPAPDMPGIYLSLIERMQGDGLYYASLAHIDAYEHEYGVSPESILLRADALRATGQRTASAATYSQLLATRLAARAHRGLGLLAGAANDFPGAARELGEASRLAPTDALTLSDLGYALLREGNAEGARVPLLKAIELDSHDPKIAANVALYFASSGDSARAQTLIEQQGFSPEVRAAVERDAQNVADALHRHEISRTGKLTECATVSAPPYAVTSTQVLWPCGSGQPRIIQHAGQ